MGKTAAVKNNKGKGKVNPVPVVETVPVPVAELPKNAVKLADGEVIMVRGPEKYRAMYQQGNVGWQDMLRNCRLALNLATYTSKIGAADTLTKVLREKADQEVKSLEEKRVRIPSDMTTQHAALQSIAESAVGTPDYIVSLRKLAGLVKFADKAIEPGLMAEIVSAKTALNKSK